MVFLQKFPNGMDLFEIIESFCGHISGKQLLNL